MDRKVCPLFILRFSRIVSIANLPVAHRSLQYAIVSDLLETNAYGFESRLIGPRTGVRSALTSTAVLIVDIDAALRS
jgi:hypothetical protein